MQNDHLAGGVGCGYFVVHEEMQVRILLWARAQVAEMAKRQRSAAAFSPAFNPPVLPD